MRQKFLKALGPTGFHRLAYTEWGAADNPRVLVCVHGLSRNGRDFDKLAGTLAKEWRIVCPDMPGRGESDWLTDRTAYGIPTYLADCAALIARLDVDEVAWLGTSMGGIIGIYLASLPGSPIRKMVVNDVGPFIPAIGLQRIALSLGKDPRFADITEADAYIRKAMSTFGIVRTEDWRHVTEISVRPAAGGGLRLHYDPGILDAFFAGDMISDINFWPVWQAITCPVLVLRGEQSDILPGEVAREMTLRGPCADLVELSGCGHAPALLDPDQIAVIGRWLTTK
ncbi:alpha/beta hydrolase [Telmatospirillum sp.]|uniref:alpha/beta fold hydrolase n=1 Tax=Telmatospirillum sp. TaxID=2079197 RepID=UPI00283E0EA5|nr:alpha/beta hydrolase [Telmatospirillum sp.]MDR3440819.1 alpha/beta hydrolase [Telmatospirillum sp.]